MTTFDSTRAALEANPFSDDALGGAFISGFQEGHATGLRDALAVIDAAMTVWKDEPAPVPEPPHWAATNALIQQIASLEGKDINEVVASLPYVVARR